MKAYIIKIAHHTNCFGQQFIDAALYQSSIGSDTVHLQQHNYGLHITAPK